MSETSEVNVNLKDFVGPISRVLVANRGEIAVRVMRTLKTMHITSVAVYSDVDRAALHVRMADEAYCIGEATPSESYLNIDKIIALCKEKRIDAVHPGYGFLSENPRFARALKAEGIILIGPPAEAMDAMATKTMARRLMSGAGVPVVPGLEEGIDDADEALMYAESIGFPVMLKAAAGGGGKGMRRVNATAEFMPAWQATKSEAKNAFGDDEVYIEKFLEKPRHIEIQVFADSDGRVDHLFERECSVQRRHQKVIEEAPSPFVDAEMRQAMGEIACKAARAVGYLGAGTVEFLVDAHKNFYFMEMNTRLQVEHPVTEMITGLDLVKAQVLVAMGEALFWPEQLRTPNGWAIEARICAESPERGFIPTPGPVEMLSEPTGPGIRVDSGIYEGTEISPTYDSMVAKVIAHGDSRESARIKLIRALTGYTLKGTTTNCAYLSRLLKNDDFVAGHYDTGLVQKIADADEAAAGVESDAVVQLKKTAMIAAALRSYLEQQEGHVAETTLSNTSRTQMSSWQRLQSHDVMELL